MTLGNDRQWVQRPSPRIQFWRGDEHLLSSDVTLVRTGGHFLGSTTLHIGNRRDAVDRSFVRYLRAVGAESSFTREMQFPERNDS
jgi:hypothetical protein